MDYNEYTIKRIELEKKIVRLQDEKEKLNREYIATFDDQLGDVYERVLNCESEHIYLHHVEIRAGKPVFFFSKFKKDGNPDKRPWRQVWGLPLPKTFLKTDEKVKVPE